MTSLETYLSPQAYQSLQIEKLRRKARKGGSLDFTPWLERVTPHYNWHWPHIEYVRQHLNKVTDGTINRLMINMPPRHGKSEQVTIRYPAWRLETTPGFRVAVGSHSQTLAEKFSRGARRIVRDRGFLGSQRSAVKEWETTNGGAFRACAVGSPPTGEGFDLIVVDDPVKSREEARSDAYRRKVWEWYTVDLFTRLEPGGAIVVIMTRWDEDDLGGRLERGEDGQYWHKVVLPALAEEGDPLGRVPGEALCPERFDEGDLQTSREIQGNSFYALYQQRPQPLEGGMFKRGWFSTVGAAPAQGRRVRYWDKAGTEDGGAYTCGVLMVRDGEGRYFVEDVVRGQWSARERERIIHQTAEEDRRRHGKGVHIWIEMEPGSGGKESAEITLRNLAGYTARAERPTGDKVVRAEPFAAQCEAGNVRLVGGDWNKEYLEELTIFPSGKYADQVDASSGAFNRLTLTRRTRTGRVDFYEEDSGKSEAPERRPEEEVERMLEEYEDKVNA